MDQGWYRGRRVTVMGLGRHGGGLGAARYLARQGARLTITDLADAQALAEPLMALGDLPVERLRLGEHCGEDFAQAEAVIVNPAVKPGNCFVQLAHQAGAHIITEVELFLQACPAKIVGITGSNGKSTTASMIAAILQAQFGSSHGFPAVWLGGNFGGSLLDDLPRMTASDIVVLELSSFQLHYLSARCRMPAVAVVTNCAPNHLDWHGSFADYRAAKQRLLSRLPRGGVAVINGRDPEVSLWRHRADIRQVSLQPCDDPVNFELHFAMPGEHNRANAACAAAAAKACGATGQAIEAGLKSFRGLPHRLELVAENAGRRFYNDSKATTPAAALAALAALDGPIWLLAGGVSKGADYREFAAAIRRRVQGAAFFGSLRDVLQALAQNESGRCECHNSEHLSSALQWCWTRSRPGDTILLSPGCASFDQYLDYAHRGAAFKECVQRLAGQAL